MDYHEHLLTITGGGVFLIRVANLFMVLSSSFVALAVVCPGLGSFVLSPGESGFVFFLVLLVGEGGE